jgi:hypothetical protein
MHTLLAQWANITRGVLRTRMSLRTTGGIRRGKYMFREFLWQEGHTAHSIMTKLGRSPLRAISQRSEQRIHFLRIPRERQGHTKSSRLPRFRRN